MFQILIVEDDKELSQLFQKVLEKNGYQVKSASDGAQALEVLDKEYIDLIISDIMMPVMDGYELVSELRSAGYQIPVLMITAKGSFDDMRQGFLSGSDDYMVKPVNVNEMVLRVGALFGIAGLILYHLLQLIFETRSSSSFIRTDILPILADAVPKVRFSDASLSIQLALHDTDHDRFHLPIPVGTLFHIPPCSLPTVY